MLRSLFSRSRAAPASPPRVPDDVRVYAIGDIHGRADLFADLIARIAADHAQRPEKRPILILLGDLIDRGADSAGVVARAVDIAARPDETHVLAGNHEELMLRALDGDGEATRLFCRVGGRETMLSYGVTPDAYDRAEFDDIAQMIRNHVPHDHLAFLRGMEDLVEIGDYAFVHAGIRPGVPLARQKPAHLRWIRGEFLEHRDPHPRFIVHGHTISDTVDERPNRVGIDTGAYASGRLTAIALEDDRRWFITTG